MATIVKTQSGSWKAVIRITGSPLMTKTFRINGISASSVRLELALLSHLYPIAIKEWAMGLITNPVSNIRKPKPAKGRDRRLVADEEQRLLHACEAHSNPMLAWIVEIALYTGMRHGEIVSENAKTLQLKPQ